MKNKIKKYKVTFDSDARVSVISGKYCTRACCASAAVTEERIFLCSLFLRMERCCLESRVEALKIYHKYYAGFVVF